MNGLLITTDEFGRFHVPCASLPVDIGSNFTLKLDPRTLPAGYALTTENPRTLRLTPGKVAKMNFCVTLTEMVDVGLTARAFMPGTTAATQALIQGVKTLIRRIADTPSVLRLTYLLGGGEDSGGAVARLRSAQTLIRKHGAGSAPMTCKSKNPWNRSEGHKKMKISALRLYVIVWPLAFSNLVHAQDGFSITIGNEIIAGDGGVASIVRSARPSGPLLMSQWWSMALA